MLWHGGCGLLRVWDGASTWGPLEPATCDCDLHVAPLGDGPLPCACRSLSSLRQQETLLTLLTHIQDTTVYVHTTHPSRVGMHCDMDHYHVLAVACRHSISIVTLLLTYTCVCVCIQDTTVYVRTTHIQDTTVYAHLQGDAAELLSQLRVACAEVDRLREEVADVSSEAAAARYEAEQAREEAAAAKADLAEEKSRQEQYNSRLASFTAVLGRALEAAGQRLPGSSNASGAPDLDTADALAVQLELGRLRQELAVARAEIQDLREQLARKEGRLKEECARVLRRNETLRSRDTYIQQLRASLKAQQQAAQAQAQQA